MLEDMVLDFCREHNTGSVAALASYIMARTNDNQNGAEIDAALASLVQKQLIKQSDGKIRLSEPDRAERDLYPPLAQLLTNDLLLARLGISDQLFVFHETATGGNATPGRYTRPDFTIAAIRTWRFDPQRTLEVYTFEVKNRAGATASAVYETVAHGRFAHHPYLVCPRSKFFPSDNVDLQTACLKEGVGLMLFDIVIDAGGRWQIENLDVVCPAERRIADPILVEGFLTDRLPTETAHKLEEMAK